MLFHISTQSNLKYLTPRIPRIGIDMFEDTTIPRVCFAPSINCCLRAICLDTIPNHIGIDDNGDELIVTQDKLKMLKKMSISNPAEMILKDQLGFLIKDGSTIYPLYHAYVPIDITANDVYTPSKDEVFDVEQTHEKWVKKPCAVKKVFSFLVTGSTTIANWSYTDKNGVKRNSTIDDYSYMIVSDEVAKLIEKVKKSLYKEFINQANFEKRVEELERKINLHIKDN